MRPDPVIKLWDGDTLALNGGVTLIRCGGHFAGGTVLYWPAGGAGRGALLTGDIVQLIPDKKFVTFMRSYPNMIPLSAKQVTAIGAALEPFAFDTVYSHFFDRFVSTGGKLALQVSIQRYLDALAGAYEKG